ncbi:hypothetical protein SKAU_G00121870 [Synaphobranchus kaupii]|uniref:Uncharacterized protein n=1 Tax=Synaphobranchus kaupii TaxID=118154 RepID=A0A9Q1FNP2_SYNKA|nr:hypothetical protein SKAU_G00121870 [Synaphobranchus kaupii]
MMQAGVCLRQGTATTLPELTEQHSIRQKEEEPSGLESVFMESEWAIPGLDTLEPESVTAHSGELYFSPPLSSSMMQTGVRLRQDTATTLPELTEQCRIRPKEEELSGLESVYMESETEWAIPGLDTLEPERVTAHSGSTQQVYSIVRNGADSDAALVLCLPRCGSWFLLALWN